MRWLLSCVFADHPQRRQRLAAAIELAQADPPPVHQGDLLADLPAMIEQVPAEAELVVFHSAALCYVSAEVRQAFAAALATASRRRDIVWISNEAGTVVPEITALAPPTEPRQFLLGRTRFVQGQRTDELLAVGHPHGADLQWLASAAGGDEVSA